MGKDHNHDNSIIIHVNDFEKSMLYDNASEYHMTVQDYIREKLFYPDDMSNGYHEGILKQVSDEFVPVLSFMGNDRFIANAMLDAQVHTDFLIHKSERRSFMPYAYVDGSYDKKTNRYGWGVFLQYDKTIKYHDDSDIPSGLILQSGYGSNEAYADMHNVGGEITAAMMAVSAAIKAGCKSLIIYYDYSGIEYWVTGQWKANKDATNLYGTWMRSAPIYLEFVPVTAHTGVALNEHVDKFAKGALGIL